MQSRIRGVLGVAALIAMTSCGEEPAAGTGDLQVVYRVGSGSQTCEDAGIAFVEVEVLDSSDTVVADTTVVCSPDDQSVILEDIVEGSYNVVVSGLNDQNAIIYSGETSAPVTVAPDQTNGPETVVLDQLKPSIMVWIGFADVGGCERFGVDEIVVVLYENGSSSEFDETYACSDRIEEGLLIEDLSATSTYDLRVRGTNENGEYTYEFDEDGIAVAAGPPTEVSAELSSCSGVCSAP